MPANLPMATLLNTMCCSSSTTAFEICPGAGASAWASPSCPPWASPWVGCFCCLGSLDSKTKFSIESNIRYAARLGTQPDALPEPPFCTSPPSLPGALWLPDSPNSLIERGRLELGRAVLERIRGTAEVDAGTAGWAAHQSCVLAHASVVAATTDVHAAPHASPWVSCSNPHWLDLSFHTTLPSIHTKLHQNMLPQSTTTSAKQRSSLAAFPRRPLGCCWREGSTALLPSCPHVCQLSCSSQASTVRIWTTCVMPGWAAVDCSAAAAAAASPWGLWLLPPLPPQLPKRHTMPAVRAVHAVELLSQSGSLSVFHLCFPLPPCSHYVLCAWTALLGGAGLLVWWRGSAVLLFTCMGRVAGCSVQRLPLMRLPAYIKHTSAPATLALLFFSGAHPVFLPWVG